MDSAKSQLADKLKSSNNVLVTVSRNPSVDQLAALLGLTLLLNKLGKHAAAVFSGQVPSTIEFLQPEDTFEKTTDSLRDFIIALDKSKADKLRYKVEDNVVRIFITPYRTSINQDDLEFSQGDFNVDLVIGLGVSEQEDLDQAVTAHGRILHDATVATINTQPDGGDLGSLNWRDQQASSLSELITELAQTIGKDLIDGQIATALLTGIVSETDRFSNDRTSSHTMSASATLLAAGANQQLVASKLEPEPWQPAEPGSPVNPPFAYDNSARPDDGTLQIDHSWQEPVLLPEPRPAPPMPGPPDNNDGILDSTPITDVKMGFELPEPEQSPEGGQADQGPAKTEGPASRGPLLTEPPVLGGTLTSATQMNEMEPSTDPFSMPQTEPPQLFDRSANSVPAIQPPIAEPPAPEPELPHTEYLEANTPSPAESTTLRSPDFTPPPVNWVPPATPKPAEPSPPLNSPTPTLTELEASVHSPHINVDSAPAPAAVGTESLDAARDEVSKALGGITNAPPGPIQALNAQPLGGDLRPPEQTDASSGPSLEEQIPGLSMTPDEPATPPAAPGSTASAPPPVPPPLPMPLNTPSNTPPQQ